jgi:nickel-dependent lactate racemase
MVSEAACAGRIDGNPVRADIEEAERMCPADFILNVVLDEHKKVVRGVAGDVKAAHRKGCEMLSEMYTKPIGKRADIVIVSQGGAPKDANLYQTQKALDNAKHAVRDGGTIILIGACNEGFGNGTFERWMLGNPSPAAMIDGIGKHFELGGHKAAAIAMVLQHAEIDLVSELDPDTVRRAFLVPYPTAQAAFDNAMRKYGKGASVICMPYGGSTLPVSAK